MRHMKLDVRLNGQLGRISPTALQDSTKAVQAFGCSMAQAAQALQAIGNAAKGLEAETAALAALPRGCMR